MKKTTIQMMVKSESDHRNQHNNNTTKLNLKHRINIQLKKDNRETNMEETRSKRVRIFIENIIIMNIRLII